MCRIRRVALSFALLLLPLPAVAQYGGGLSGTITSGGSPVPGVEIQLQTESCDCRNCRTRCGRCCPASTNTFSDSDGHYSFPELGPGVFRLTVTLPGFGVKELRVSVPDSGLSQNIDLGSISESITVTSNDSSSSIEGTAKGIVVDAKSGQRLKDTELLFVGTKPEQCRSVRVCVWPTRTNAKGQYRAELPAGIYRIVVATPKVDLAAGKIQVLKNKETAVDVKVDP